MGTEIKTKSLAGRNSDGTGSRGSVRIPSVAEDATAGETDTDREHPEDQSTNHTTRPSVFGNRTKSITVPLADANLEGYCTRMINVRLDRHQGMALKRLRLGLENAGEKLANGSEVSDNSKVIRWILEQLAKVEV